MTDTAPERGVSLKGKTHHLVFLANFTMAKAAIYLLPLMLAAIASAELYGGVELALAIGLQACAVLLGAPLAGITQLFLIRKDREVGDLLLLLTFVSALILSVLGAALWLGQASPMLLLTVSILSLTVLQNTASTWFRMRGERNRTAWADGASLLIVGLVVGGVVVVAGADATGLAALVFMIVTGLIALGSLVLLFRHRTPELRARLARASRIGLPMMVAGIFAIWLGVGGRIIVGVTSADDLAAYSLAFRIAGFALGVHQLAVTAAFPALYASRTRRADRLLTLFLTGVLAVSLLLALAGPYVVDLFRFSALRPQDVEMFKAMVPLNAVQTYFWIGYALLQLRINRYGVAKASIVPLLAVTGGGILIIFLVAQFVSNDVRLIVALTALHAAAYFATAWILLAKRRLPHKRVGMMGLLGGLALGAVAAFAV